MNEGGELKVLNGGCLSGGRAYRWMDVSWFEGEEKDGYVWDIIRPERKTGRKLCSKTCCVGKGARFTSTRKDTTPVRIPRFFSIPCFSKEIPPGDNDTLVADRFFDSVFMQGQSVRHCVSVRRASSDPQSPDFRPETDCDFGWKASVP